MFWYTIELNTNPDPKIVLKLVELRRKGGHCALCKTKKGEPKVKLKYSKLE